MRKLAKTTVLSLLVVIGLFAGRYASLDAQSRTPQANALDAFPKGVILAWYSKSGKFPAGWAICDGTNGTPDLRDQFLRGVGNMADVGKKAGAATHAHTYHGTTGTAAQGVRDAWNADGMNRGKTPQTTGLDHSHNFNGTTDPASNLPPYVTVIYMMKL